MHRMRIVPVFIPFQAFPISGKVLNVFLELSHFEKVLEVDY